MADCQEKDPANSEIYLVEGDSAGGFAKQGRDRKNQAILPLRGKILNVERARFDKMISSQEVGTLITALGCGIGREDFDPEKLRYHRIIIMTDADVDGAHIRTLLLTFFYRQMRELVEGGHIYIAQPPLYKVKKGKQEQYLKDDTELNQYLLQSALDKARLHVNSEAPALSDTALETIATDYVATTSIMQRLSKRYNPLVIEKLLSMPAMSDEVFDDITALQQWLQDFKSLLNAGASAAEAYEVEARNENDQQGIRIIHSVHGIQNEEMVTHEFFKSSDYKNISLMHDQLHGLIGEGAYIQRAEKSIKIDNFQQAFSWLMDETRRGQHIQRYKGLGEMNPEQLWETTMDPNVRRLLQVTIEDAIAADEIFTTLMGEHVEPRREFIERNALDVENLDV